MFDCDIVKIIACKRWFNYIEFFILLKMNKNMLDNFMYMYLLGIVLNVSKLSDKESFCNLQSYISNILFSLNFN